MAFSLSDDLKALWRSISSNWKIHLLSIWILWYTTKGLWSNLWYDWRLTLLWSKTSDTMSTNPFLLELSLSKYPSSLPPEIHNLLVIISLLTLIFWFFRILKNLIGVFDLKASIAANKIRNLPQLGSSLKLAKNLEVRFNEFVSPFLFICKTFFFKLFFTI